MIVVDSGKNVHSYCNEQPFTGHSSLSHLHLVNKKQKQQQQQQQKNTIQLHGVTNCVAELGVGTSDRHKLQEDL